MPILCFGSGGSSKTHVATAIGDAVVEQGRRMPFTPATISFSTRKRPGATSRFRPWQGIGGDLTVRFKLIDERYERHSLVASFIRYFREWERILPDAAMVSLDFQTRCKTFVILEASCTSN